MPKIESKYPQNIHNLIELLFVDLDIWVNSNIPSPFLSFSLSLSLSFLSFFAYLFSVAFWQSLSLLGPRRKRNTRFTSEARRQQTRWILRSSWWRGTSLSRPSDTFFMVEAPALRIVWSWPQNLHPSRTRETLMRPILSWKCWQPTAQTRNLTCTHANSSTRRVPESARPSLGLKWKLCPRRWTDLFYHRLCSRASSSWLMASLSLWMTMCLWSRTLKTQHRGETHTQSLVFPSDLELKLFISVLFRWFMKITDIITTVEDKPASLFRGVWLEFKGRNQVVKKNVYTPGKLSTWQSHRIVDRVILVHHNCSKDCTVSRTCRQHPRGCHLQCKTMTVQIHHSTRPEFLVEEEYKNLSS